MAETADGWHPLHCAAKWNSVECAHLLLKCDADVNAKTNGGEVNSSWNSHTNYFKLGLTPLHLAATNPESKELLEVLLLHPLIDTSVRDASNDTPENIAHRHCVFSNLFKMCDKNINVIWSRIWTSTLDSL